MRRKMIWAIRNACIDFSSIDHPETARTLLIVRALALRGRHLEANQIIPPIRFDFDTFDMDSNPRKYFLQTEWSISLDYSDPAIAHYLAVDTSNGDLLLSIAVGMEVELVDNVQDNDFQQWLHEHEVWTYGIASGGWSYRSDQGGDFRLA